MDMDMERDRVLILVPSLAGGGQERQAIQTAKLLLESYEVYLVVFTLRKQKYASDVPIIDLNLPTQRGPIRKFFQQVKRAYKLFQLRRKLHPLAVFSFGDTANLSAVLSHGYGYNIVSIRGYAGARKSFINTYIFRRANLITCVSKEIKARIDELFHRFSSKTRVIYNALDLKSIRRESQETGVGKLSEFQIISVGRLTKIKGLRHLLRAFKMLVDRKLDVTLLMLGDGEEMSSLVKLAETLGIAPRVHFLGFQSNPYAYMRNSDLFVLTSIHEGFPNVILEAMACGLPVVSTDCYSGPLEILGAKREPSSGIRKATYGILVPAFSHDCSHEHEKDTCLADAMELMVRSGELRNHYRRQSTIRAREFHLDRQRDELIKILTSLRNSYYVS